VYSDKFEFPDEKLKSILGYTDEEITRLKSIQGKSSHSAWLTFMYPRLRIAQRLLKDDGVIFVSIDEHECYNLLHLASEIFGENSFETLVWRKNGKQGNTKKISRFKNTHEFIVVIYRNIHKTIIGKMKLFPNWKGEKTNADNDYRGNWESGIISLTEEKSDPNSDNYYSITLPSGRVITREFYLSKEEFDISRNDDRIYFPKDGDGVPRLKIFEKEEQEYFFDSIIDDMGTFTNAREEIENIFGNKEIFDTPKPVKMIKELIRATSLQNSLILDFFAGSATTADAVMQLNAEDGGNRKFIMVQLDEETNPDSEARKAGYDTIDEIARERIIKAGEKTLADYDSDLIKRSNGWDKDIGFKHYRLVTPDVKTLEKIVEFKPDEANLIADDMIKPFEYEKTKTGGLDTILATWLIDDGFRFDTHVEEIVFGNYKAHYVREAATLYLINRDWGTAALKTLLNQIGTNKLLVTTIVVYPYSFEFEAMRELKTNIKTNLDAPPNLIERF
jgi:adenine-specific DNA-methyltransferase